MTNKPLFTTVKTLYLKPLINQIGEHNMDSEIIVRIQYVRATENKTTYIRGIVTDKAYFGINDGNNEYNGNLQLDIPIRDAFIKVVSPVPGKSYEIDDCKNIYSHGRHAWVDIEPNDHVSRLEWKLTVYRDGHVADILTNNDTHNTIRRRANTLRVLINKLIEEDD